jgi:hypothetical protein
MSLKPDNFDFLSNLSTLWAVFLGAILATIGGLAGTQLEWFFERRRREQDAALFFGELLTTLNTILTFADSTRAIGDPYGPVTIRVLRGVKRELEIYDRNREALYGLRNSDLRARIHSLVVRLAMPLDGILEASDAIQLMTTQLQSPDLLPTVREDLEARVAAARDRRHGGFEFLLEVAAQLKGVVKELEPVARQSFDHPELVRAN